MSEARKLDVALRRLVVAAKNGMQAKAHLAKKLATLSPAQLREVKPSTFAALGPRGISLFADAKGTDSGLAPVSKPIKSDVKPTLADWGRAHPWLSRGVVVLLCVTGGGALERTLALRFDAGEFATKTYQGWPVCQRLEATVDGCVYFTTSNNVDINQIAAQTRLPVSAIVATNPTIDFHYRLPRGAMLIVPGRTFH